MEMFPTEFGGNKWSTAAASSSIACDGVQLFEDFGVGFFGVLVMSVHSLWPFTNNFEQLQNSIADIQVPEKMNPKNSPVSKPFSYLWIRE